MIEASCADNLGDFTADWKHSMNRMLDAMKEVDEETMKMIRETVRALFEIAGAQMRQEVKKNLTAEKEKLRKQSRPRSSRRRS